MGIPSLALGLFSHFQSIWTKGLILIRPNIGVDLIPLYRVCDFQIHVADIRDKTCPNIALEQFYVAVIMICFAMSVLNFIIGFVVDLRTHQWKIVVRSTFLYHNNFLFGNFVFMFTFTGYIIPSFVQLIACRRRKLVLVFCSTNLQYAFNFEQ